MRLETFRGPDIATVSAMARAALGDDVMVLSTEVVRENGRRLLEITAASAGEVERMRLRVRTQPGTVRDPRGRNGPLVIALVGPTGAGKTTTIAKLAVNPDAFGTYRVGLLALDTY